jgi:hypothetical protein
MGGRTDFVRMIVIEVLCCGVWLRITAGSETMFLVIAKDSFLKIATHIVVMLGPFSSKVVVEILTIWHALIFFAKLRRNIVIM